MKREICKLSCVHQDNCNKKFNEIRKTSKNSVINIHAQCGLFFFGIKKGG